MRYRLVRGRHVEDIPEKCPVCKGEGHVKDGATQVRCHRCLGRCFRQANYGPGDVFESAFNLAQVWPEKFELLDGSELPHPLLRQPNESADQYASRLEQYAKSVRETTPSGATASTLHQVSEAARQGAQGLKDNLEHMSLKELQAHAAAEEIDLKGAKTREEVLKAIRAAKLQPV